uniref:Putative malectin n=1 Tax=Helianthus annuus TaxID=4232 RepID=A0A251RU24_HELAN
MCVHYFNSYLTKNNLTGAIPGWVLSSTKNVDVSYNHFTWDASSGPRKCDQGTMLHFAEIVFTQDKSFNSLGKRVFDVYVQGELKLKDFNIVKEAGGTGRAVVKSYLVNVKNNTLKIQLYWAGKGTTGIPVSGSYGPIISAISIDPIVI